VELLLDFLAHARCDMLYLVGDVIDLRSLRRSFYWPKSHTEVLQRILEKARADTRVVYVPGNHDDDFRALTGMRFSRIEIEQRCVHTTAAGKRLLVLHGDEFDSTLKCGPLAALVGHVGYRLLLAVNRLNHRLDALMGRPYWSLAQSLKLRVGKKNLAISPSTGHSSDGISVFVEEDRILFAGDAFMPIPYVVDGSIDQITEAIKKIGRMSLENIIQGHGEVILRGEIETAVRENLAYLAKIRKVAKTAARRREPQEYMDSFSIEDCGKSRVHLGGLAVDLHRNNLKFLYLQARDIYLDEREKKREERKNAKAKATPKPKAVSKTKAKPKAKVKPKAKPGSKPKTIGKKTIKKK